MRTIPSVMEYSLWSRRWTKAGFGIAGELAGAKNFTTRARPASALRRLARSRAGSWRLGPAGGREGQRERGLRARLPPPAHPAAVQLRDRLHDRETEPRPGRGPLARAARAVE